MEHVPVWLHKFWKKQGVICNWCNMNSMRSWVSWPKIIWCSHYSGSLWAATKEGTTLSIVRLPCFQRNLGKGNIVHKDLLGLTQSLLQWMSSDQRIEALCNWGRMRELQLSQRTPLYNKVDEPLNVVLTEIWIDAGGSLLVKVVSTMAHAANAPIFWEIASYRSL